MEQPSIARSSIRKLLLGCTALAAIAAVLALIGLVTDVRAGDTTWSSYFGVPFCFVMLILWNPRGPFGRQLLDSTRAP